MRHKWISITLSMTLAFTLWVTLPSQRVWAADCTGTPEIIQFRSATSGDWNDPNTWECSVNGTDWQVPDTQFPTYLNDIVTIQNGHTVEVSDAVTVDQIDVDSGGTLWINYFDIEGFRLNNGPGYDLDLDGTMLNQGRFQLNTGATWRANLGGVYTHDVHDSVYLITQMMSMDPESTFTYRGGGGIDVTVAPLRTYGNLYLECASGVWIADTSPVNGTMTIMGDFIIGSGVDYRPEFSGEKVIEGEFVNNGTLTDGAGTLTYQFTGVDKTIGGTSPSEFENWEIATGAAITVAQEITATGTLTNCGEIRRTKPVNGITGVGFFNTGGYGGVILNANDVDLGETTVTVQGNKDCTSVIDETVKRCFDIEPANSTGTDATITFYFDSSEVTGTNACDSLEVYQHNGSGWDSTPLTLDTSYDGDGRMCGADPQSVRVVNVSSFSPFVLKSGGMPSTNLVSVTKTANPTSVVEPGGSIEFTVVVENRYLAQPVTIDSLEDSIYGDLTDLSDEGGTAKPQLSTTCAVSQIIQSDNNYTCSFTAMVSGNTGDNETNQVTASGTDDEGNPVGDSDDATVTIVDAMPSITVTKTANPTSVPAPGGEVTFTVLVENTSNAEDPVTITSLVDSIHGDLNGEGDCSVPQTFDPGGDYSCSFTATVSGNIGDSETDEVTATGSDDEDNPVSGSDEATVMVNRVIYIYLPLVLKQASDGAAALTNDTIVVISSSPDVQPPSLEQALQSRWNDLVAFIERIILLG